MKGRKITIMDKREKFVSVAKLFDENIKEDTKWYLNEVDSNVNVKIGRDIYLLFTAVFEILMMVIIFFGKNIENLFSSTLPH